MSYFNDQVIVTFGGPDRCGKTTIAKQFSLYYKVPYFKPNSQKDIAENCPEIFRFQTRWGEPKLFDFIKQTKTSVVMDRGYPCDWVYSTAFQRNAEWESLKDLDDYYSKLPAINVFTVRKDYKNVKDEWDKVNENMLYKLDALYRNYAEECKVPTLVIETTLDGIISYKHMFDVALFILHEKGIKVK